MTMLCTPAKDSRADLFEVNHGSHKTLHDQSGKVRFIDYSWNMCPDIESSRLILSYHNFEETPPDLEEILHMMHRSRPAKFYKIATRARSTLDALRMLEFVRRHPQVIGLCMGELGSPTRILAPIFGSPIMYASISEENALGQIPLDTLLQTYHFRKLHPQTPIYGLIGDPISQSPGHIYHNQVMQGKGVYIKMPIKSSELTSFFSYVRSLPFQGLSVTIPHKEAVLPFLDQISELGAVNTISLKEGRLIGTNTDGPAALQLLGDVAGKKIFILGAGGSARAITTLLLQQGAKVTIFNRTLERAQKLACELRCFWKNFDEMTTDYDILINTTPCDPAIHLKPQSLVIDLSLKERSPFLERAIKTRTKVISGHHFYVQQARLQQMCWQSGTTLLPAL